MARPGGTPVVGDRCARRSGEAAAAPLQGLDIKLHRRTCRPARGDWTRRWGPPWPPPAGPLRPKDFSERRGAPVDQADSDRAFLRIEGSPFLAARLLTKCHRSKRRRPKGRGTSSRHAGDTGWIQGGKGTGPPALVPGQGRAGRGKNHRRDQVRRNKDLPEGFAPPTGGQALDAAHIARDWSMGEGMVRARDRTKKTRASRDRRHQEQADGLATTKGFAAPMAFSRPVKPRPAGSDGRKTPTAATGVKNPVDAFVLDSSREQTWARRAPASREAPHRSANLRPDRACRRRREEGQRRSSTTSRPTAYSKASIRASGQNRTTGERPGAASARRGPILPTQRAEEKERAGTKYPVSQRLDLSRLSSINSVNAEDKGPTTSSSKNRLAATCCQDSKGNPAILRGPLVIPTVGKALQNPNDRSTRRIDCVNQVNPSP